MNVRLPSVLFPSLKGAQGRSPGNSVYRVSPSLKGSFISLTETLAADFLDARFLQVSLPGHCSIQISKSYSPERSMPQSLAKVYIHFIPPRTENRCFISCGETSCTRSSAARRTISAANRSSWAVRRSCSHTLYQLGRTISLAESMARSIDLLSVGQPKRGLPDLFHCKPICGLLRQPIERRSRSRVHPSST